MFRNRRKSLPAKRVSPRVRRRREKGGVVRAEGSEALPDFEDDPSEAAEEAVSKWVLFTMSAYLGAEQL